MNNSHSVFNDFRYMQMKSENESGNEFPKVALNWVTWQNNTKAKDVE